MKYLMSLVLLILAVFTFGACGSLSGAVSTPTATVTAEAVVTMVETPGAATYANILPEDAKKRLDSETGIVLLDVRTQEEYTEKHIPNSMLIPVDVLDAQVAEKIPDKNTVLFVYCRSGNRSVTASEILVKLGYTKVFNLGGIKSWPYETVSGE